MPFFREVLQLGVFSNSAHFNFSPGVSPSCMNFNLTKNETTSHYVLPKGML